MSVGNGSREYRGSNRRDTRVVLEARVQGRALPVRLYDVSVTGCRIDCSTVDLSPRDKIVFKFADDISVAGKIAWRRGDVAGVKFASSLPDAIAQHLHLRAANGPRGNDLR